MNIENSPLKIVRGYNTTWRMIPHLTAATHKNHTSLIKPKSRKQMSKRASSNSLLPFRNSFLFSQALVELLLLLVDGSEFTSLVLQSHNGIIHLIQHWHKHNQYLVQDLHDCNRWNYGQKIIEKCDAVDYSWQNSCRTYNDTNIPDDKKLLISWKIMDTNILTNNRKVDNAMKV